MALRWFALLLASYRSSFSPGGADERLLGEHLAESIVACVPSPSLLSPLPTRPSAEGL